MSILSKSAVRPSELLRRVMRVRAADIFTLSNLVIVAVLGAALLIGMIMPLLAGALEGQLAKLAALPALLVFGLMLLYDRRLVLLLILMFRSTGDIYLDYTKFALGGLQIGVGGIINMVVIGLAVLFVLERPKLFPKKLALMWLPFIVFGLWSVIIAPSKGEAIRDYLGLVSYFSIFICTTYLVRTPEDFKKMLLLVIWASVLPSLYSLVDIAINLPRGGFRLRSTFSHPNIMACYLVLIITLVLYVLKSPTFRLKPGVRVIVTLYMLALLVQLVLTQTRSAWIACLVVFMIYAVFFERKYLFYLLFLPLLILVPAVRDRIVDMQTGNEVVQYAQLNSFAWRVVLWKQALAWIEPVRFVVGYGLESFRFYSTTFFDLAGKVEWNAHNVYVQYLFELGILGLGAYLYVFGRMLVHLKKGLLAHDRLMTFLMMSTIGVYLIISASDNVANYLVFNWYFWFSAGCACNLVSVLGGRTPAPAVGAGAHPAYAAAPAPYRAVAGR